MGHQETVWCCVLQLAHSHALVSFSRIVDRRAYKMHFEMAPLKISRASKQYMFDDQGNEYLDCISTVAHGTYSVCVNVCARVCV